MKANMFRMPVRILAVLALAAVCLHAQDSDAKRGRKYKAPPTTSKIEVTVLRATTGKPIENASVVFHELDQNGKDDGNMELKTNEDGKTLIDVIETGKTMRLQIIAKGFQTYGNDYKIDKSDMAFEIRMKRPGEQYSTYKPHPEQNPSPNPDQSKPDAPKPPQP
jgi:5-hydroxyisourate hydrolase-like protein (transthyretin family)